MAIKAKPLVIQKPAAAPTNAVAELDIREVKPPVPVGGGWGWLGWAVLVAALAGLAAGLWWYRRRRRLVPVPALVIPPHIIARDKLRAALGLLGQPEPFCVAVSQIIRVYLEQQFHLHAPERTTEEFLEELRSSALLGLEQKRRLADFLMRCDLVKFARYEPGEPELRDLYDAAVRLVEETEGGLPAPAPVAPCPPAVAAVAAGT
jgi:hypothetical protein